MTNATVDGLVDDYIARLESAAHVLPPERAADLVEDIREHIATGRAAGEGGDETAVRALLHRLGSPEEIVAAASDDVPAPPRSLAREGWAVGLMTLGAFVPFVGWLAGIALMWSSRIWTRKEKLLGTLVMPLGPSGLWYIGSFRSASNADCGPEVRTTRGSTTTVSRVCEGGDVLGLPTFAELALIVGWAVASLVVARILWTRARRRAGSERDVSRTSPWTGLEITAVVLLAAGSFLFPVVAPLGGLVLALCSPRWRRWEKAVACALCLTPVAMMVSFYATAGKVFGVVGGNGALLATFASAIVLSAAAALFLGLRLSARATKASATERR